MSRQQSDPIISDLERIVWRLRAIATFEQAGPWLAVLFLAGSLARIVSPGNFTGFSLPVLFFFALAIAVFAIRDARKLSLGHAASQADYGLRLPDSFSAYLEYFCRPDPGPLHRAHLHQVGKVFPAGVPWRPGGPRPWKSGAVAGLFSLGLVVACWPGPLRLTTTDRWPTRAREAAAHLRRAADGVGDRELQELAVSLEQFAAMAEVGASVEKERLLRELRRIQREINSSEARLAGEFLGELLQRSALPGTDWDLLGKALQEAQWQKAAELARRLNRSSAAGPGSGDVAREIARAFEQGRARAGASSSPDAPRSTPPPELARRLAALAGSRSSPAEKAQFDALRRAHAALAGLSEGVEGDGGPAQAGRDPGQGKSLPLVGPQNFGGREQLERKESVSPLVAEGPGDLMSIIIETQDTGLPTVFSEETYLPEQQTPAGPVPRIIVPHSQRELVRRYFRSQVTP